jgi:hypothetical protein
MSAVTRWVKYDVTAAGVASTGGANIGGRGTRGYDRASSPVGDGFTIGTTSDRLYLSIDGGPVGSPFISLASGIALDPRFVARDITEKLHTANYNNGWKYAQCVWENNHLKIYSGSMAVGSQVVVASGINTAHLELGWGGAADRAGGVITTNPGDDNYISVSGTYNGFFDETYTIVISNKITLGTPVQGGANEYGGIAQVGGVFNYPSSVQYIIQSSDAGGPTPGGGTGYCPTLTWTTSPVVDDSSEPVEIRYADHWYKIGTLGLMMKFTDGIFNTTNLPDNAWTVACLPANYATGTVSNAPKGTAEYIWGSNRGDNATTSIVTPFAGNGDWNLLGSRGLYVQFDTTDPYPGQELTAGDVFTVLGTGPQPSSYDITNLNYGNVTVSTESPVRSVIFEIMSGAVLIDTVKFGLQSHGNFEHHGEDTYFRFGTAGPGNNAGTGNQSGLEWRANVTHDDLNNGTNTPPDWLYATKYNLLVVGDADASEAIGTSTFGGMVADPIWLNIKLGQAEVGANSTINYRVYFDYQ